MSSDAPKPVLSEEQLDTLFKTETNWIDYARAVERAVLEAVGGQYDALNRGIIADLAPVNAQPHSYARGAVLEAVDTITALRAFHDRAIDILGSHGALDQGVEVDALTWLADVLTQADGLRARVAELERDNAVLESKVAEMEAGPGYVNATGYLNMRDERDAARRELEEVREDTARLDWMNDWADRDWDSIAIETRDGRFCGVNFGHSQHGDVWDPTCEHAATDVRAALDSAREGKP